MFPTIRFLRANYCALLLLFLCCCCSGRILIVVGAVFLNYNLAAGIERYTGGLRDEVRNAPNRLYSLFSPGCPCDMNSAGIINQTFDRINIELFVSLEFAHLFCFLCAPTKRRVHWPP